MNTIVSRNWSRYQNRKFGDDVSFKSHYHIRGGTYVHGQQRHYIYIIAPSSKVPFVGSCT